MDLRNVKMVVTDMDGTLLNKKHEISPLFNSLFKELLTYNITFVAASGRPFYGMANKLRHIKDDIIIVAENGGLVVKNNETLLSNPIDKKHLCQLLKLIVGIENTHPVFCTRHKAYVMSNSEPLLHLLKEYYGNYEIIQSTDLIDNEVYKIALYHEESSEKYIYPHVKHLEQQFKVKLSATHWVDISENIANKGTAVKLLQDKLNISKNETLAFGDYNNDLEMLENAYFSYAMANAHPLVKRTAKFETKSNDNFGVEVILQKLLDDKRKSVVKN